MSSSDLTEILAHNLEAARLALREAETAHTEATARAEALANRLAETRAKREAITERRLNGAATTEDAHEFGALTADIDALAVMLTKAQTEADATQPDTARAALANAEHAWQQHQKLETIRAVTDRAKAIERRLVEILGELATLSIESGGQNFRDVWSPSEDLETIMRHSRPETIAGLRRAA
jgi:chromosome segregation ATPase